MKVTDQQIIDAIQTTNSMLGASRVLGVHISSLKPRARRLGVYNPNQGRVGEFRSKEERIKRDIRIPLTEILEGKHPQYNTTNLRKRLIEEGLKRLECEMVGCPSSDPTVCYYLDHIDGNCHNHLLSNLRILCPNCHSKTSTYSGRNKQKQSEQFLSDTIIIDSLISHGNIRQALIGAGLRPKGANYKRATRLIQIIEHLKTKWNLNVDL